MVKTKIDFKSFIKKGTPYINDNFNINLITGYQGSGKTWFSVYLCKKVYNDYNIFTNIKTLHGVGKSITYFENIDEIIQDRSINCVYVIDELSKKYNKNSSLDKNFYSWLQQSRKHQRHIFLITQEYINVPNWLRGIATTIYTTKKLPFFPIFKTTLGIPILDKDTFEWSSQTISQTIYKRTLDISNLYDTFEAIDTL